MNVVDIVLSFGTTRADETALIDDDRSISYGGLAERVRRTARHLIDRGLRPGERIGLCLGDHPDHIIALLGAALARAVVVPLDWRAPPDENSRFVEALGLTRVLIEADSRGPAGAYRAGDRFIPLDAEWHRDVARVDASVELGGAGTTDDPFIISASSGSTGAPKMTLMTHGQFHFAMSGMFEILDVAGRHRYLSTLPLYYSGGRNSCLAHLLRGDRVTFQRGLFRPEDYVDMVGRGGITVGVLVPTAVRQLLSLAGAAGAPLLPGLTRLFSTGATLHADEKLRALQQLTEGFHERYGTAETLALSVLRPQFFASKSGSVGQPHSLARVQVVDENDRPLAPGAEGRIRIGGPGVGTPVGEAAMNFRGGWFYPGEIARIDPTGFIFLEGRVSDVIVRSGAKIHPAEVEAVLLRHPRVTEAAVFGVPAEEHEEAVVAFVIVDSDVTVGALIGHCRTLLTPHKVPRILRIVRELPRNAAGKIDKPALTAAFREPGRRE